MSTRRPGFGERFWMGLEFFLAPYLFRRYLRSLALKGSERVLEVGCGSGALTREISRMVPSGSVVAIEMSPYWAESATRRLRGRANVHLWQGDVRTADLRPASFDAVFFHFVLHDIPECDRSSLLSALHEALAPGGLVYLREPISPRHGLRVELTRTHFRDAGFSCLEERMGVSRVAGKMLVASYVKGGETARARGDS